MMQPREEKRLIDCWRTQIEADPSAVALITPSGERICRIDIDRRGKELARSFELAGLKPRAVLLVSVPNGLAWLAAFLACLEKQIVAVFADPGVDESEIGEMAQAIGASGFWNGGEVRPALDERVRRLRNSDVVLGKLTSGSTGLPKCLFFKDSEMVADGQRTLTAFGYEAEDLIFGLIPWGHSYGLGSIVVPFLILGCRITWLEKPLPAMIEQAIAERRPTVFPSVPTLLKALAQSDCQRSSFESIRVLITAGSRLDPQIAERFQASYGVVPRNLYGSSETGSICFDPTGESTANGDKIGMVLPGVKVRRCRDGRLRVASDAVFTHGNRMIEETGNGACRVGDVGVIDEEGFVSLGSRAKGFVKVGERRIGLAEVERRLESLPEVSACQALSVTRNGEVLLAAVLQSTRERKEIARLMRAAVPSRFRPAVWVVVEELPTTARGKIDSREIQKMVTNRMDGKGSSIGGATGPRGFPEA